MANQQGKFVWFTLFSNDVERAKGFYSELFGWKIEDMPMPNGTYHVFKMGDVGIGGTTKNPTDGAPSHWLSYLSVDDVDQLTKSVKAAGGSVLAEPHDVPTIGRESIVTDPQGAAVALFKGANGDPPDASGAGSWHWNELWTKDDAAAVSFLTETLGYQAETMDMPTGPYHVLKARDVPRAGAMKAPDPNVPPMWLGYVEVDDVDDTARRAKGLGAELVGELMDVPNVGRFGILKDPTGAVVGVIKPAPRP